MGGWLPQSHIVSEPVPDGVTAATFSEITLAVLGMPRWPASCNVLMA